MALGLTRDVSQHQECYSFQTQIMRAPSPVFSPPVPSWMREPGTNFITIVTAEGPHTTQHPGTTGGRLVMANNRNQNPVVPLTRKGG